MIKLANMILGVSKWLGDKLGVGEEIVRLTFVVSVLIFGLGILTYLICWGIKSFS